MGMINTNHVVFIGTHTYLAELTKADDKLYSLSLAYLPSVDSASIMATQYCQLRVAAGPYSGTYNIT